MPDLQLPAKGQCYCKRIQYTLNANPIFTNACHCRDCQTLTGSAFAINIMVEASAVSVTSDLQPTEKVDNVLDAEQDPSTDAASKSYRCPSCDVLLWGTSGDFGDGIIFVRAGTLVENEKIVPDAHFFVRSKHPWITIPEGVRTFETLPTGEGGPLFSPEAGKRFAAARK